MVLHDVLERLDAAIDIDVPTAVVLRRLSGRRVCGTCGAIYHLDAPPRSGWVCDIDGGAVVHGGVEVDLTTMEFEMLWALASQAGQVLTRDDAPARIAHIDDALVDVAGVDDGGRRVLASLQGQTGVERDAHAQDFERVVLAARLRASLERQRVVTLERDLLEAQRLATVGRLAAGTAHELNNPSSAARRAGGQLQDAVAALQADLFALAADGLTAGQLAVLQEARAGMLEGRGRWALPGGAAGVGWWRCQAAFGRRNGRRRSWSR